MNFNINNKNPFMRCSSYCTASEYKMVGLVEYLNNKGLKPQYFDDAVYVQLRDRKDTHSDVFFFPFGCITIWGSNKIHEEAILQDITDFEIDRVDEAISDFIYFEYNDKSSNNDNKTFIDEERNKIVLANKSEYIKLSISHALAQSVKLSVLEKSVSKIQDFRNLRKMM